MVQNKLKGLAVMVGVTVSQLAFSQSSKLTTSQLSGQVNTVTTAVPFLMIGPDSRAGAMGDAGVATLQNWRSLIKNLG